jgi:hypothetical protein
MSKAVAKLEDDPNGTFVLSTYGDAHEAQIEAKGLWDRVRGIVFELPETTFIRTNLTKRQERTLLLLGWRRSPLRNAISYTYALHGKLKTDFLGGALVDALREVLGGRELGWFELEINGTKITSLDESDFESSPKTLGKFRIKGLS